MAEYVWEEADKTNPWGRKRAKGTHCSKGHEFTEENTFIRPYDKTRVCRECRRRYARKKYQDNKAAGKSKSKLIPMVEFELPRVFGLDDKPAKLYKILNEGLRNIVTPCQKDTELFDNPETVTADQAEDACHGCPLLKQCHDFASANKEEYGIWGGINFTKERYKNGTEWFESEDVSDWFIEQ
jgi:hypothetical protein